MNRKRRPGAGRPTAGLRPGEKSSEYQRLTMRLPPESVVLLKAIARTVDQPGWRVMVDALQAYVGAYEEPTSMYARQVLSERSRIEQIAVKHRRAI